MSIRHAAAAACVIVSATVLSGIYPAAGLAALRPGTRAAAAATGGALRHPVVLMHNQPIGNPATVAALPVIIRFFRAHGYRFVKL